MSPLHQTRRSFLSAAGAAALSAGLGRPAIAQGTKPIKIALVTSLSGVFSGMGESMRAGLQLLLAEAGGTIAGRPVELIVEDDQGKPDEGVRKFRKVISQDNADILCGVISSAVALAIRDVVTDAKALTFIAVGSANDLARKAASPYVFRPTKTNWMLGHTAGLWAYDKIAQSGCMTLGADYAAGREFVGDFVTTYKKQGGKVHKQLWTPLGTADFAPILTSLATEKPKLVYAFFAGSDAVRFLQQMRDFRLTDRLKLLGTGALCDQEDVLPAVGDAAAGIVNTFHQSPTAPSSKAFTEAYAKARGRLPGEASSAGYATGQTIKAALERVAGDPSDREKFREAVLSRPIETIYGAVRFDPRNNQAILNIYVNEVRKGADGKLINTVVHTYKDIQDPGPTA